MTKQKYYINLASHEISEENYQGTANFCIYADDEEIEQLRSILNTMDEENFTTFWRAHVPFVEYHNDTANYNYDQNLMGAFQMMHDLGDDETKEHIQTMGILNNRPL